jgi:hypothetical protein
MISLAESVGSPTGTYLNRLILLFLQLIQINNLNVHLHHDRIETIGLWSLSTKPRMAFAARFAFLD